MKQYEKIDRQWKFHQGPVSQEWTTLRYDDRAWREVNLPHDWSIEGAFDKKYYLDSVREEAHLEARDDSFLPRGTGCYRKMTAIPQLFADQAVFIEFEGVFGESVLYADGVCVGENHSGYAGKLFDLSAVAADKEQVQLALSVDASRMQGWWYEGAGIYRHVHLIVKPALHMVPWGVTVTTPEIDGARAWTKVHVEIADRLHAAGKGVLHCRIVDPDGNEVAAAQKNIHCTESDATEAVFMLPVASPRLWSADTPHCYRCVLTLETEDGSDTETATFGIRSFYFTADQGFFLNGKHVQLRGGNIHHDFAGLGTALPDRAHEKNVEVLKAMGANVIRSAHNPAAPALMEACDRLGMFLWAETRNLHTDHGAEEELTRLIRRDRNHPSIIAWSLANTGGALEGRDTLTRPLRQLHALVRKLDPTRPTAVGLEANADANANGFADVTDVVGYNGGGMGIDDRDHREYPERKMIVSEYASGRGARGVYRSTESEDAPLETLGDGRVMKRGGHYCSEFDLCRAHEAGWEHIAQRPHLAGGMMWSIIEYRGETTGWPIVTSQFGVLDLCRFPKDAYYYYLKNWTSQPMLHCFPHWTWPGREGEVISFWCYSNCDTVDLYLNGKKLSGRSPHLQRGSSAPHREWAIPYQPGILEAEGRINGEVVCRRQLRTAGAPVSIRLTADRTRVHADGEDLSFIRLDAVDANGTVVPDCALPLEVKVSGAGRLLGLSSGDPGSHESEKGNGIHLFHGSALAIVQSREASGKILVAVTGSSLRPASVELYSE